MSSNREHPSLRFQHGEIKDFYTAMAVYVQQYQFELQWTRETIREYPDERPGHDAQKLQEQTQGVQHIEQMCMIANTIYRHEVEAAMKRAAAKMREQGDSHLRLIADALEQNNYDGLAL